MSTSQAIHERIAAQPAGEPVTPALFAGLGLRASIDQTVMRLTKEGLKRWRKWSRPPKAHPLNCMAPRPLAVWVSAPKFQPSRFSALPVRLTPCGWASCGCDCNTSRLANWCWPVVPQAKPCPHSGISVVGKSRRPRLSVSPPSCRRSNSRRCAAPRPPCLPGCWKPFAGMRKARWRMAEPTPRTPLRPARQRSSRLAPEPGACDGSPGRDPRMPCARTTRQCWRRRCSTATP